MCGAWDKNKNKEGGGVSKAINDYGDRESPWSALHTSKGMELMRIIMMQLQGEMSKKGN